MIKGKTDVRELRHPALLLLVYHVMFELWFCLFSLLPSVVAAVFSFPHIYLSVQSKSASKGAACHPT